MNYNKQGFQDFRKDFKEAVLMLENKHGINISLGTITYDDDGFRVKITARNGAVEFVKKLSTNDFNVGDMVSIKYKKFDINEVFNVIKINRKKIKVQNGTQIYDVPPSLLILAS